MQEKLLIKTFLFPERVKKMENEFDSDETMTLLPGRKRRIAMIQADFDNCDQPLVG